jgi:hypothetical protein
MYQCDLDGLEEVCTGTGNPHKQSIASLSVNGMDSLGEGRSAALFNDC